MNLEYTKLQNRLFLCGRTELVKTTTYFIDKKLLVEFGQVYKRVIIGEEDKLETLLKDPVIQEELDNVDALQGDVVVVVHKVKLDQVAKLGLLGLD